MIYSHSNEYIIKVYGSNGTSVLITRDEIPARNTDENKLIDYCLLIRAIMIDEEDNIWVWSKSVEFEGLRCYERDGTLKNTIPFSFDYFHDRHSLIKEGYFYILSANRHLEWTVRRMRLE